VLDALGTLAFTELGAPGPGVVLEPVLGPAFPLSVVACRAPGDEPCGCVGAADEGCEVAGRVAAGVDVCVAGCVAGLTAGCVLGVAVGCVAAALAGFVVATLGLVCCTTTIATVVDDAPVPDAGRLA
jgi:hypothetical protein